MTTSVCETVTLTNKRGLHARASNKFVACALTYDAVILVRSHNDVCAETVMADSIMELLLLGSAFGEDITISAEGPQAGEAVWCAHAGPSPWVEMGERPGTGCATVRGVGRPLAQDHAIGPGQVLGDVNSGRAARRAVCCVYGGVPSCLCVVDIFLRLEPRLADRAKIQRPR